MYGFTPMAQGQELSIVREKKQHRAKRLARRHVPRQMRERTPIHEELFIFGYADDNTNTGLDDFND